MSEPTGIEKFKRLARRTVLRVFPPCSEVVRLISASLDRPLNLRERVVMKMHLLACKPCVRYLDHSSFLSRALKVMDRQERSSLFSGTLSEESRARLRELLRKSAMSF